MNYQDFFTPEDVATFKRVKGGSMRIAHLAREVAAEMVDGTLQKGQKKRTKEYIRTPIGLFRLAMARNSDNPTETREHHRLGARVVVMGDDRSMGDFFDMHGLHVDLALIRFKQRIHERL